VKAICCIKCKCWDSTDIALRIFMITNHAASDTYVSHHCIHAYQTAGTCVSRPIRRQTPNWEMFREISFLEIEIDIVKLSLIATWPRNLRPKLNRDLARHLWPEIIRGGIMSRSSIRQRRIPWREHSAFNGRIGFPLYSLCKIWKSTSFARSSFYRRAASNIYFFLFCPI